MQKEKESEASSDASYVNDSDDGGVLVVTHMYTGDKEWILHSGCSFHMTPHKEFFTTMKRGGSVTLGNDDTCMVVGIGSVTMRMHDGVIRVLDGVRHVLNLKKNLISLVTFNILRCRCTCEGGVMKITKGSLILMKGSMVGGLYVLQGSLVTDSTNVSSSTMSEQETKLWHMRLGQLSEQSMNVLSKKGSLVGRSLEHCHFVKIAFMGSIND